MPDQTKNKALLKEHIRQFDLDEKGIEKRFQVKDGQVPEQLRRVFQAKDHQYPGYGRDIFLLYTHALQHISDTHKGHFGKMGVKADVLEELAEAVLTCGHFTGIYQGKSNPNPRPIFLLKFHGSKLSVAISVNWLGIVEGMNPQPWEPQWRAVLLKYAEDRDEKGLFEGAIQKKDELPNVIQRTAEELRNKRGMLEEIEESLSRRPTRRRKTKQQTRDRSLEEIRALEETQSQDQEDLEKAENFYQKIEKEIETNILRGWPLM